MAHSRNPASKNLETHESEAKPSEQLLTLPGTFLIKERLRNPHTKLYNELKTHHAELQLPPH